MVKSDMKTIYTVFSIIVSGALVSTCSSWDLCEISVTLGWLGAVWEALVSAPYCSLGQAGQNDKPVGPVKQGRNSRRTGACGCQGRGGGRGEADRGGGGGEGGGGRAGRCVCCVACMQWCCQAVSGWAAVTAVQSCSHTTLGMRLAKHVGTHTQAHIHTPHAHTHTTHTHTHHTHTRTHHTHTHTST